MFWILQDSRPSAGLEDTMRHSFEQSVHLKDTSKPRFEIVEANGKF